MLRFPIIRRLLIIAPLVLALILVSVFLPARQVTIESVGRLSFETTVTLSIGSEVVYASPASLYEYYNTGDDSSVPGGIYGVRWRAQTFTPSVAHKITSVKLKLFRSNSPGTVTVSIKATDGSGHPTGADLCSGTINGNTLTTDTNGAWYEITLGSGYNLSASTKYAIVTRAPSGNASNYLGWRYDGSSPTYAGGNYEISNDGGSSWSVPPAGINSADFMFEEWGEVPNISNAPSDWTLNGINGNGKILPDMTYYANPLDDTTAPSSTVLGTQCRFTLTNSSSIAINLTVTCGNFNGGDANMTNSNTGSNGATSYGAYCWYEGMTYTNKVIVKSAGSDPMITNFSGASLKWGAEIKTRTNAWTGGTQSTATMTITATAY